MGNCNLSLLRITRHTAFWCCLVLAACSGVPRQTMTLPQQLAAELAGFEDIRFFADSPRAELMSHLSEFRPSSVERPSYLSLSGGGQGGAFGAGVLVGWSKIGTRPQFDLVTGISVGALIAPFAFVGSEFDNDLEELFTSGVATRLDGHRSFLGALLGRSVLSSEPLRALITDYVDKELLDRVAARHKSGARLLVVTTNIDAQRSVVWNMGAIAASDHPRAAELFSEVLAASASIPAIFPPVRITAVADGMKFEELHVDGGASRQIFFFPDAFLARPNWQGMSSRRPQVYAIANHEIAPNFEPVEDKAVWVAEASFRTLVKANLVQSLSGLESFAKENALPFRLIFIDRNLASTLGKPFDPDYMRAAFALGQAAGRQQSWSRAMPIGSGLLTTTATTN